MRFQVPQFIDIEDKIVGPFTLKQFLIYFSTVLLLIPVYLFSDISLFVTVAVPVGAVAALFAHFKKNGRSLFTLIGDGVQFASRGQLFLWQRAGQSRPLKITDATLDLEEFVTNESSKGSALESISRALATDGKISTTDETDPFASE